MPSQTQEQVRHRQQQAAHDSVPSAPSSSSHGPDYLIPLDGKLAEFLYCLSPSPQEREVRLRVVQDLQVALRRVGLEVRLYGSLCTGLVIPASDLDCIMVPCSSSGGGAPVPLSLPVQHALQTATQTLMSTARERRQAFSSAIRIIANTMRASRCFRNVVPIAHAKVPIVKCVHREAALKVDLSFEKDGCVSSSYLCEEFCKPGHELARPLIILVKAFLNHCGLDDPSVGGLGSFPVSMMVLWYLSHQVQTGYPPELRRSIGVVMAGFFKYYGVDFDYKRRGIDYVQRKEFSKAPMNELFILNPIKPEANCARAASMYPSRIIPRFAEAAVVLSEVLGKETGSAALEETLFRFFGSAVPEAKDWRDVKRMAYHSTPGPQNLWDAATNIYIGGVL